MLSIIIGDQLLIYEMQMFQKCLLVYVSYRLLCAFVTNLGYLDAVSGTICSIYVEVTHPVLRVFNAFRAITIYKIKFIH